MKYEQNMNKEGKKTPGAYCVWLSAGGSGWRFFMNTLTYTRFPPI